MLLSTYNPNAQAQCPKCKKVVNCLNIGGMTFGSKPYLDFQHEVCGTEWRYYINTSEQVTPIPTPPTLKEMMGESPTPPATSEIIQDLIDGTFLTTPDEEFRAFVAQMTEKHWTKYDLSAVRLGWEAHKRLKK